MTHAEKHPAAARRTRGAGEHPRPGFDRAALLIFALALLVRVVYVLQARANPQFDAPLMDPAYHDEWARALADGTWRPEGPFFRAPLYPLFLAAIYKLAGPGFLVPRLVQAVLGSLSCVLLYWIGRRLFGRTTGWIAGTVAALYWVLVYFDNELLIPPLFVFLTLAFFLALLHALEPPRRRPACALAGLLFGLAAIARPNVLVFSPVVAWLFWRGRRAAGAGAVAFALAALLPIGAVTAYNAIAGGDPVFIAAQGGVNFYIGNNPDSDGHTAVVPGTRGDWWGGRHDTIKIAERAAGRPLKESEVSSYWFRRGLAFITEQPAAWLALTLRKLGLFWMAHEIGNNASIPHLRAYAPIMKLPLFGFGLVAPLACAGAWLGLRHRRHRQGAILPLAFIVLYTAGVVAFFVCARYRVPILPFLILFAALAVTAGLEAWRAGARRDLAVAAAIFVTAALAMNLPARGYQENIALARFHDSVAWKKKGDLAEAERALRDALRIDPGLAEARANLANLLAERGEGAGAREAYQQAVAADPNNAKTLANLASLQLQEGDPDEAERTVRRALAIDPDHAEALRILGVIRERRGDLAGARAAYEQALRFTSERERLENNLGVLCMREGDTVQAERHLRRAIEIDSRYAMAWANLGALLVNVGRAGEAVDPLQRAAELQPRDAAAWQRLAEVLQALGRTDEAARARARASQGR